jgi:hypothetical protein
MFEKLIEKFIKKPKTSIPDTVKTAKIDRVKVDRIPIKEVQVGENSVLVYKFRDTTTGKIVTVDFGDHDKFDECMSNKNMRLVFD